MCIEMVFKMSIKEDLAYSSVYNLVISFSWEPGFNYEQQSDYGNSRVNILKI